MGKVTTVNQLQTSVTRIAGNISTALNTVAESLEEIENLKADKTVATSLADGLMSASDKTKLDNLTAAADTDTFLTKTDAASTYVTKDGAKVLSTNDYTTEEKTKLSGIESGAQVNVIETVKVNNSALTPSNKTVNIDLSNYVTKDGTKVLSTNDYTAAEKNKLGGVESNAQVNIIETVKVNNSALTPSNKAVNIDLTGYVTSSNLTSTLASYAKTSDITAAYIYKGSVNAFSNLPTSGYKIGDVWNIKTAGGTDENGTAIKAGDNVARTSTGWDVLGGTVDLSNYVVKDGTKVLSTNDFTTALKTKLEGIGTGNTSTAGLTKLYTGTGTNNDGTMTQSALKTALDGKFGTSENAASATKLNTARSLKTKLDSTSAVNFDGSANVTIGVEGVLPVANGGTGNSNGTVAKLTTARSLKVSLASSTAINFDGSANCTVIGVGGTLPIANGGTGQTTAAAARNALGLGNTTGALPIANGGTGATTAAAARNALGLGNTTGALPIANGGTGQTTAAAARNALGLGNTTGALPVANGGTGNTIGAAQQFFSLVSDSNSTFRNVWFGSNASSLKAAYDSDFQYNPSTNILNVQNINGTSITISGGMTSSGTIKGAAVSVSGGLLGSSVSVSGDVTAIGTLTGAAASLSSGGVITTGTVKGAAVSVSGGVSAVGSVTGAGVSVSGDITATNVNATNLNVTNLVLSSTASNVDNALWIEWE